MKGSTPTKLDKAFWHSMAGLGCVACSADGNHNPFVAIHHITGRTQPGAHRKILPLCAQHHQQDDSDPMGRIAVHPNKARFEQKYGNQYDLLAGAMEKLGWIE